MSEEIREIDRALRRIARRQATLDVELLAWLRRAEEEHVWPKLGYVHALEYLEEVFAFAPRTAIDRLRVANELGELPIIEKALACGELAYGAVRELTRVATAETEAAWLGEARGKRLRDVERMVAGRKKGDGPDAKPDPNRIRHGLWLELDGEAMAAWRQMRAMLDDELGEKLDDRMVVLELARRCLAGDGSGFDAGDHEDCDGEQRSDTSQQKSDTSQDANATSREPAVNAQPKASSDHRGRKQSARPMHMQHNTRCPDCRRGWQLGAGEAIEISASALAEIECDAVIVDDENGGRAAWTIPPATRRKVIIRDHGRCQVPGCRAARFLAVHHIIHREHGGTNDEWNLIVLCFGHHKLHHDGILEITGRAPDRVRFVRSGVELLPGGRRHIELLGDRPEIREVMSMRRASNQDVELARAALTRLGFTAKQAKHAVEAACAHGGTETLEGLLREALRQCQRARNDTPHRM